MLSMSARDLLAFAQMHLDHGSAAGGARVLSPTAVQAMQVRQVDLPDLRVMGNAWGLGWELFDLPGQAVIGHDGNTLGQASFLRVVPDRGLAVVLLTNGGDPYGLYHDVVGHLLEDLAGVQITALPVPPADPAEVDATRYVGTYANRMVDVTVSQDQAGLVWVQMQPKQEMAELTMQGERKQLVALAPDVLIPLEAEQGLHVPHAFVGDDGAGHAQFLHIGRVVRRVPD